MKKGLLITDIHEFEGQVCDLIDKFEPDFILDCGDHDDSFFEDKIIPWYFINGNHENTKYIQQMRHGEQLFGNLHLLEPGYVLNIEGVGITGFGGNYSHKSFTGANKKPDPLHILPEDLEALKNIDKKEKGLVQLLLMHESGKEIWKESEFPFGQDICDKAISYLDNLKMVVNGHYHVPRDEIINNVRQISLNTPQNYSHLLLGFENGNIKVLDSHNESNPYEFHPTMVE